MENATDAIFIASAMLLFLIALSVAMFSVSELRQGVDSVFTQTETVEMAKDSGKYINFIESSEATRIVDSATVVSSMMRSTKENYVVYIKLNDPSSLNNYYNLVGNNPDQIVLAEAYSELTINSNTYISPNNKLIEITIGDKRLGVNQEAERILSNNFFKFLSEKTTNKFYEFLGVYQNKSEASSENKVTYRIITYVEI